MYPFKKSKQSNEKRESRELPSGSSCREEELIQEGPFKFTRAENESWWFVVRDPRNMNNGTRVDFDSTLQEGSIDNKYSSTCFSSINNPNHLILGQAQILG